MVSAGDCKVVVRLEAGTAAAVVVEDTAVVGGVALAPDGVLQQHFVGKVEEFATVAAFAEMVALQVEEVLVKCARIEVGPNMVDYYHCLGDLQSLHHMAETGVVGYSFDRAVHEAVTAAQKILDLPDLHFEIGLALAGTVVEQ
jgi:hypothetical protein